MIKRKKLSGKKINWRSTEIANNNTREFRDVELLPENIERTSSHIQRKSISETQGRERKETGESQLLEGEEVRKNKYLSQTL